MRFISVKYNGFTSSKVYNRIRSSDPLSFGGASPVKRLADVLLYYLISTLINRCGVYTDIHSYYLYKPFLHVVATTLALYSSFIAPYSRSITFAIYLATIRLIIALIACMRRFGGLGA